MSSGWCFQSFPCFPIWQDGTICEALDVQCFTFWIRTRPIRITTGINGFCSVFRQTYTTEKSNRVWHICGSYVKITMSFLLRICNSLETRRFCHHHHHQGWSIEMQIRCARYWQVSIRGGRDGLYICSSGVARNSVARSGRKVKDINVKEFCLFYVQLWLWHLKNIVFQNSIWKFKTPGMRRRWCVGGTATKAQDSRDGAVVIQLAR